MNFIVKHTFLFLSLSLILLFSCSSEETKVQKELDNNTSTTTVKKQEIIEEDEPNFEKSEENPYKMANIEVKVFNNAQSNKPELVQLGGYGYDIYIWGDIYIHQPTIPAINGNHGFKTEEDAQKVGELMAFKIRNNIMPPAVSVNELDSLEILK